MIVGSIARRYAKALLALGAEEANLEPMLGQLEDLTRALAQSSELRQALSDPVFPLAERRAALDALGARLGVTRTVRSFTMLLLDRGRVLALPDITREFRGLVDARAGRVRARVTSARPLSPELEARLRTLLEQRLGKRVVLEKLEDPTLLGGLTAEVGDLLYDGSLRHHLEALQALLDRGQQ
jgi:F-type H+-transporting ATPase subunit delta